jgi:hypothetical protein
VNFSEALIKYLRTGELYESNDKRRVVKRGGKALQVDKGINKPCYYDVWR